MESKNDIRFIEKNQDEFKDAEREPGEEPVSTEVPEEETEINNRTLKTKSSACKGKVFCVKGRHCTLHCSTGRVLVVSMFSKN